MRRAIFLFVALGACSGSDVTNDAGTDATVDASSALEGSCSKSIAAYCDAYACPSSPSAAIAQNCGWNTEVLEGCGYVNSVTQGSIDTSQTFVFDPDGGLIEIQFNSANTGNSSCVAGPPDASLIPTCVCAQGCAIVDASCD